MRNKPPSGRKPFVSILIPVERKTKYLREALDYLSRQTYPNFEVIISSSVPFSTPYSFVRVVVNKNLSGDVASKRNQILKFGKGEIFIFNDDDVFTPPNYLENIVQKLKDPKVLIAAGPLLTPPSDSFMQQASGCVWESYLGSLGAGVYRSRLQSPRIVYDYPAANLILRRKVFEEIGGLEKGLYPGEDTKLCLDILNKYQKGVAYDPSIFVYHHRKPLFKAHLSQIGKYGHQRGWFALSYPETSFRIQYFFPSLFLLYVALLPLIVFLGFHLSHNIASFFLLPLLVYSGLLVVDGWSTMRRKGSLLTLVTTTGIITTHLYYGYRFLISFIGKIIQRIKDFLKILRKL